MMCVFLLRLFFFIMTAIFVDCNCKQIFFVVLQQYLFLFYMLVYMK